jgi:hypothetical protein
MRASTESVSVVPGVVVGHCRQQGVTELGLRARAWPPAAPSFQSGSARHSRCEFALGAGELKAGPSMTT